MNPATRAIAKAGCHSPIRRTVSVCHVVLGLSLWWCWGCAPKLPAYPWQGQDAARRAMALQAAKLRTLSAQATLHMTRSSGDSVTLDAAIVAQWPHSLRLRAWKFSQAVFDLTLSPDGAFLLTGDKLQQSSAEELKNITAARLLEAWSLYAQSDYADPQWTLANEEPSTFTLQRPLDSGVLLRCVIDKPTRVVRAFEVYDDASQLRMSLKLSRHRQFGDVIFPMRMLATSEHGTLEILLRDAEVNEPLAPGALQPPRRAVKLP